MDEKPRRAVLSVANKDGIVAFAQGLVDRGFEIVSSGGTAKLLASANVSVRTVSEITGFPEILSGRVKTLNPKIHGGILARRTMSSDLAELEQHDIHLVDVVAVNFYPFEEKVAFGASIEEIIENIDIGGPSMLRAAAKNFRDVLSVIDPDDYQLLLSKLDEGIDLTTRLFLAKKAFRASACYESAIASFISRLAAEGDRLGEVTVEAKFPSVVSLSFDKVQDLRYGENPHQTGAFYRELTGHPAGVAGAQKLQGKELSYNNILDLDAAWRLVSELDSSRATAVVVKHNNPCGAACANTLAEAYVEARSTDPVSAFGGIVALNQPVDEATATELAATFLEAVMAPSFEAEALEVLAKKKNLRLLTIGDPNHLLGKGFNFHRVVGGLLAQSWDEGEEEVFEVVTERSPSKVEMQGLRFSWKVAKHVKSNAIVVARAEVLLGVGAGQMSRVDSCHLAISKANSSLQGAVAASDAFFPFRDGVDVLADSGITAIIQPGGSIRDQEVVQAANDLGLAMLMTGARHFRH